jgi:DNA-binding CsgD family transcriptional regulator
MSAKQPFHKRVVRAPWPKDGDPRWSQDLAALAAHARRQFSRTWLRIAGTAQPIEWRSPLSDAQIAGLKVQSWSPCLATDSLSVREFGIYLELAAGHMVGEIAARMYLSAKTVSTYRARIMEKTGLRNNAEFSVYACRHALVDFGDLPRTVEATDQPPAHPPGGVATVPALASEAPAFFGEP